MATGAFHQELQISVAEAAGENISQICGVKIGACVLYTTLFVLCSCYHWTHDGLSTTLGRSIAKRSAETGSRVMKAD